MKNKFGKVLILLTVVVAMVAMLALPAAAVTVTGVSGVEVTVDSNGSISESSGTVTATVKGSFTTRKTTTITVTNTSGNTATISFDYSVSNHDSSVSTIDDLAGADSGSYSVLLTAGATKTFTMCSKRLTSNTTATATLSSFKVEAAASESNVTVTYGSLGSVKIDGTAVASGSVNAVDSTDGASFVAVPGSGSKFVAWINPATNAVISTTATYQLVPTEAMALHAVFANASAAPVFYADGTAKVFESLDAALSYVSSASNKTITLASDATLAAGNYTIPAGVTLNIPFDAANTLYTTKPGCITNSYTAPSVYRKLNMASGANITVNGALSLSANLSDKYNYNGMPSGPLPFINMAGNSKITVESGAALYAWGYITGSGSVEVKSGGTVYENFQIADYRGGDATTAIVSKDDDYGVFPFNQYYIQNIEVPMTLHAGATENGHTAITVTLAGTQRSDVPFIGSDNAMFTLESGYVVKDYIEGTGRLDVKIYGDVKVSTMSISMKVSLIGNVNIDSSKYALPISQHLTISVESGNITMNQSVAFLPGSELYIREGATCALGEGKKIIAYDLDQWLYNSGANGYSGTNNLPYMALKYVPGGNGTTGRSKDALIQVDGEIDASATGAAAYTTAGCANIYSTGTGKITLTPGTETVTYQVTTNSTDISGWPEIALKPIVLQDADGTDVSADVAGTYTYYAPTGKWCKPGHRYESVVTAPTCNKGGYTTYTCIACGDSYTGDNTEATGIHTEVIDPAVKATCTKDGLTEGSHCSVCGTVIKAQENVEMLPHTEVIDAAVDATCTENGLTEGKHCSVCGEVMDAQEVIPALGHTEVIDAAVAATCTEIGKTQGKHCSACGKVLVAQEEIPALGHKEVIDAAVPATCTATGLTEGKHCSVCGEVILGQEETPALGHKEVTDAAVAATCTATGLTEGKHCSVCGEVLVAQKEVPALGHSYNAVTTDPTCTAAGKTVYTCSNCGDSYEEAIAALGHTEVVDKGYAATYTQTGLTDGKHCSVCGAVTVAQNVIPVLANPVNEWNVSLSDNIGVNFVTALTDADEIAVTVNGVAVAVELVDGKLSIELAAAQMSDVIEIFVNGMSLGKTYSVRGYANEILAGNYDDTAKNLVKYMLNYGGAAQTYFDYNTGNMANKDITVEEVNVPAAAEKELEISGSAEGITFYGASLVYRDKIAIRFYFIGDAAEIEGAVVKGDMFYIEVAGILPQNYDQAVTVEVGGLTVSYSPMNYIVRMNNKADATDTTKALVKALYGYYTAAEAYTA